MLEKTEILFVIILLLIIYYLVIAFGAKKKGKEKQSPEIKRYLFGIRILITMIGIVSVILWFFL